MAAKFEVRQGGKDEFRWVLRSQGRILATSEAHTRKTSCLKAIESFRKAAPTASVTEATGPAAPAKTALPRPATATVAKAAKARASKKRSAQTS